MKRVVVIGGGFAGAYIARRLEKYFSVTLIDTKDYFEFTPGILRTIVHPKHMKKIQVLHKHYLSQTKFVHGEVKEFTTKEVILGKKKIPYDYLFVCSGSRYNMPIKEKNIILPNRGDTLRKAHGAVLAARNILIVGGGVVGVELAAEIVDFFPEKEVLLLHGKNVLLERCPVKAQDYVENYLKKRKVEIMYNQRMEKQDGNLLFTDAGRKIHAELCFLCTGIVPNTDFFQKHFSSSLNDKKQIKVEHTLQMKGQKTIFVVGDLNDICEEKTAQSAEKQAFVAVQNIFALEKGEKLYSYHTLPKVMVISLGRFDCILIYKNLTLTGILPALLKGVVEWKTMIHYRFRGIFP